MAGPGDGREEWKAESHYRRAALSQPLRRRIARHLVDTEEADAAEIAAELGARMNSVAYHLEVLRRLGVLRLSRGRTQSPPRYRWRSNAKWARDALAEEEGQER